ncbi:MAG: autotransporter outer membrane beta-barrel domain-containing protein [Pseudomonadota bacterium]
MPSARSAVPAEHYADLGTVGLRTGQAVTGMLGQQLFTTHGGGANQLAEGPAAQRVQLASLDPVATLAQGLAPGQSYATTPWSTWLSGFGIFGDVGGNGNAHSLHYSTGGTMFGADYRLGPSLLVGAFVGYGGSGTAASGLAGSGSIDSYVGGVYVSWNAIGHMSTACWATAIRDDSLRRTIAFPGFATMSARGSTHANQLLSSIETGRSYDLSERIVATPFVGLQAITLDQAAFTETGAGSLDLAVRGQSVSTVRSQLGTRLSRDIDIGEGKVLNVGLKIGWAHELSDTGATTTARFAGTSGTSFAVQGARHDRDSALVGIGVAAKLDPQAQHLSTLRR